MGFSNGTYSRTFNWVNDANAGIDITASRFDTEDNGFATGLSTCILKDGTQTVTANIPFAGFRLTGVGAATANTDASQAAQVQNNAYNLCTVGGTANAITLITTPATTGYLTGRRLSFKATANSTGAVTINENALGGLNLYLSGGTTQVNVGNIAIGSWYTVTYDSSLNSNAGGYVMDSLSLGGAAYTNTGSIIINNGSGVLTIGAAQVTNAMLNTMAANTIKVNATNSIAIPTDLALAANNLLGMGSSGNIAPITLGSGFSMSTDVLNYAVTTTPNTYQASPGNPTGTTSTTEVMMGLSGSFTASSTGRVLAIITGNMDNNSGDASNGQMYFGTGTAPTNGAALTGTAVGTKVIYGATISNQFLPFTCSAIISLTPSTAYWFDMALANGTGGGTAAINNLSISICEIR